MATESGGSAKPVAVIILGADALLAARPATPIQLWHGCLAAGYDLAVPATWGDELVAAECLRAVGTHPETVTIMCTCPLVARAVGDGDADLTAHVVSLVAPPVATARYLRRVYGDRRVHVTFVGGCPAAADSAIDAWLTPAELLHRFATTEIDLERQPELFESVLPPDRRRHLSQPGGIPTAERAAALQRPRQVVEIDDADVMASIRRHLMSEVRALLDVAPRLGCSCSGAEAGVSGADARLAVMRLEPPRSARPVMNDPGGLSLLRRASPRRPAGMEVHRSVDRPPPGRGSRDSEGRDADRPVATSRPASRSPLSWNLRERALPQPPTSGRRPDHPAVPRGPSSAGWTRTAGDPAPGEADDSAGEGQPAASAAEDVDAATAAAVKALELAAKAPRRPEGQPPRDASAATSVSMDAHETPPTREPGAASLSDAELTSADEPASSTASAADQDAHHQTSRATPAGGYWFVGSPPSAATDAEVVRDAPEVGDAAPVDAEPEAPTAVVPVEAEPAPPTDAPPADQGENVVAELEALFDGGAAAAPASVTPTPSVPSPPSAPAARTTDGDHDPTPPDRPWMVTMTVILLIAGVMLARNVAVRRAAKAASDESRSAGRVESVSAGSVQTLLPPVVQTAPANAPAAPDVKASGSPVAKVIVETPKPRRPATTRTRPMVSAATTAVTPAAPTAPTARADSTADSATAARAARDTELEAIRAELRSRTARLDSIGQAVRTLFSSPRPAPVPPAPPPSSSPPPPRDR